MLKSFTIIGLFGLYDYKLNFQTKSGAPTFITGPNGYGKTTVLNIIDSLYRADFEYLRELPFSSLYCTIVSGNTDYHLHVVKIDGALDNAMSVDFLDVTNNKVIAKFEYPKEKGDAVSLFFNAEKHYYIKDKRLTTATEVGDYVRENTVSANAHAFKVYLEQLQQSIKDNLQVSQLQFTGAITQEEYDKQKALLLSKFQTLICLKIMSFEIQEYNEQNSMFLKATLDAYERAYESNAEQIKRIEAFIDIISKYEFANKEMQISTSYGYRFVAKNDYRSLLKLEQLSSGEQHILVQVYELLFKAPTDALILVDEPELSEHLAWQALYLRTMKKILSLSKTQCVVSTHSPQVFESNWDIAIDLYEQSKRHLI